MKRLLALTLLIALYSGACSAAHNVTTIVPDSNPSEGLVPSETPLLVPSAFPTPPSTPVPSPTFISHATLAPRLAPASNLSSSETIPERISLTKTPTPTPFRVEPIGPAATPTYWPTVTRQVLSDSLAAGLAPCDQRVVEPGYLQIATQQFSLPRSYAPIDLVPLSDHFSTAVTLGIPTYVSASILDPLRKLVGAMNDAGLSPSILSGYRSYDEQHLAWKWWNSQYPERVAIMSARPGRSEHQLGTTVDFGSPALDHLFHVDFANTPEGAWLAENAHRYGFSLSYPKDTQEITGFKHEPWHYRYVGDELALELVESGQTLTEWQLANLPPPCIP